MPRRLMPSVRLSVREGMAIRILEPPESPWGDYGNILRHGMSSHLGRSSEGLVQLESTAPFVPPITFPGFEIVVTDEFRGKLATSTLSGFGFEAVHKARIVDLRWHTWDPDTEEPTEFPASGEPEDYILEREHSLALAAAMGPMWRLLLPEAADIEREPTEEWWNDRIYLVTQSWSGADIFYARGVRYVFVSDQAQAWLAKEAGDHVAFGECLLR
jgi:hypothetical protein